MHAKRIIPLFLLGCLVTSFSVGVPSRANHHGQLPDDPLTNHDIVKMVKAKVPPAEIIAKIKTSRCHFDTNPTVMSELKYRGVPLEVLQAMLKAPYGSPSQPAPVVAPKMETPPRSTSQPAERPQIVSNPSPQRTAVESVNSSVPSARPTGDIRTASTQKRLKEIKLRGYITEFHSPTSFEIEDYRITRDESVIIEFENQSPEISFKQADLRIGTLVEIRGLYDEETSELSATKMKLDLAQFRQLDLTTILDRKPLELQQTETGWRGLIAADGRRLRIEPETKVLFRLNKSEKKRSKEKEKAESQKQNRESKSEKNDDWAKMSSSTGDDSWATGEGSKAPDEDFVPLRSLADIGPGTTMTYHGREQADGTVLAKAVEFMNNEMEKSEFELWKKLKVKEKPFNFGSEKPGELKVGSDKYKVVPNQEVQDYVERLGQSLIPAYQKALPDSSPQKIHFKFRVVQKKGFNAGAYPMGLIIIHSDVFNVLENEAQLCAVIAHEIAHATQEHTYRRSQHNKKRSTALKVGSIVAAGFGYYSVSRILAMVDTAMVQGYGRTLENQSDRLGLQYMADSGYDIREAPRVWKLVTKADGDGPTYYWSTHDNNSERRSFMMVTIRNSFSGLNFSGLKKNEGQFQRIAQLVKEFNGRKKKNIKVIP